jgi:hypothetical protein
MKTLRDKIVDIISEVEGGEGARIEDLPKNCVRRAFIEQEADQIISLFGEIVPREKKYEHIEDKRGIIDEQNIGYNTAIRTIKSKLK